VQSSLTITLADHPGELVRVLGLIERRRFTICDVRTRSGRDPGTTILQVTVASDGRDVASLKGQIEKLVEVVGVVHTQRDDPGT
jgi:acetolactate synthase regulatory subunit